MTLLVFLKALSDLGFLYTLIGFFCVIAGASPSALLLSLAIEALALTLSYRLTNRRALRFLPLVLLIGCFFFADGAAYIVMVAIGTVYVFLPVIRRTYEPDGDRQAQIFKLFWILTLALILFGLLFQQAAFLSQYLVPSAVTTLLSMIVLNRSLRHEPEVYCSRRYQLVNLAIVLGIGLIVMLLSSNWFISGCVYALRLIYTAIVEPILQGMIYLLVYLIQAVIWLFSWIRFGGSSEEKENVELDLSGNAADLGLDSTDGDYFVVENALTALGILAGCVLLFFLLRFLLRRNGAKKPVPGIRDIRSGIDAPAAQGERFPNGNPIARVRAQYRRFLRHCSALGVDRKISDTSLDIRNKSAKSVDSAASDELRTLYLQARYNNHAAKSDAIKAKELVTQIKKGKPSERLP